MSSSTITLRDFFGAIDSDQAAHQLEDAALRDRTRSGLPGGLSDSLDTPFVSILLRAWEKAAVVREHLASGNVDPKEVALATHTIESEHRPELEILEGGVLIARVVLEVSLSLTLEGIILVIAGGEIRQLRTGTVRCEGSVASRGIELIRKESATLPLPGVIDLEQGS